jgi:hypothetical protein
MNKMDHNDIKDGREDMNMKERETAEKREVEGENK